ncbi:hypothetical protein JTB14_020073 [Gonioctena quinquepunctata]|nr:hypothetical protein JTB14_020073 [Gonioctena quinquepunctata]
MGESETEVSIKDVYILLKEVNKNLSQRIENIEESTNNLAKVLYLEVETIKKKADKLEEENKILKQQLNKVERKIITNNLVLYGLQETTEENLISSITRLFRNKLEVHLENSQINNIFRLEVDFEEDPAIQPTKDSEQEKATNSKEVIASKESQNQSKITTKTRNISSNKIPKKTTEIHRALRNQKKICS